MNILIKLTCLIGLAIAPILGQKFKKNAPIGIGEQRIEQKVIDKTTRDATTYHLDKK